MSSKSKYAAIYQCIYCLEQKPRDAFDKDHVLPEAFGKYKDNFTLIYKVCKECNGTLGRTVEDPLAHATMEGMQRFKCGIKNLQGFNPRQHYKNSEIVIKEGRLMGLRTERYYGNRADGSEDICIRPKYDDVGFRLSDGFYDFFAVGNIPTKECANSKYPIHQERVLILPHRDPEAIVYNGPHNLDRN